MAYSGNFTPRFPEKYVGDLNRIVFKSLWEYNLMDWLDKNEFVLTWESWDNESGSNCIPYVCRSDNRSHRYYPDFKITFADGKTIIVEIKPKSQTIPPKLRKGQRQDKYIRECAVFAKNISKWEAGVIFCKKRGWDFQVWTEITLKNIGAMV